MLKQLVKIGFQNDKDILNSIRLHRKVTKDTQLLSQQINISYKVLYRQVNGYTSGNWLLTEKILQWTKRCTPSHHCRFSKDVIAKCLKKLERYDFTFHKQNIRLNRGHLTKDNRSILVKYYVNKLRQNKDEFNTKRIKPGKTTDNNVMMKPKIE